VLAGGAVAHAAAVVEVEVVGLCEFEDVFFAAVPVELDARFLKSDFRHGVDAIAEMSERKPLILNARGNKRALRLSSLEITLCDFKLG